MSMSASADKLHSMENIYLNWLVHLDHQLENKPLTTNLVSTSFQAKTM